MNSNKSYQDFPRFSQEEKRKRMEHHIEASGYFSLLGFRLADLEPGYARLELPFRKEITHSGGVVQGGIITTLADSCIAHATYAALHGTNSNFTTIELKVNFIRPAKGNLFTAEANLLHLGRRTAVGESEIRNEEGKLVAKCLSSLMILAGNNDSDEESASGEETAFS